MNTPSIFLQIALIGTGATLIMDMWLQVLKRLGQPTLNFAMVGRWAGHCSRGTFRHVSIAKAPPIHHELLLGWAIHYATGIAFAALPIAFTSPAWLLAPTPAPALLTGLGTVLIPFMLMQPAMGLGVASAKTPTPTANRIRSIVNHSVFGVGLYISALLNSSIAH
ncbi:MAG TPA: DUF2938 domain-containing protein [Limnobacter sp.]|nr:DUF2938 domain-containing protein [Limnobacter sp.]